MDQPVNDQDRRSAQEFLEDLLQEAKDADQKNLLVEVLLGMRCELMQPQRIESATAPRIDSGFEILKICPDGTVSLGTIRGVDYAKKVLAYLNSLKSGLHLLYDRTTRRIIEPVGYPVDRTDGPTFFN